MVKLLKMSLTNLQVERLTNNNKILLFRRILAINNYIII